MLVILRDPADGNLPSGHANREAYMPAFTPHFSRRGLGEKGVEVRLGHPLLDDYLRFVAARCRPNSVLAAGYDLKVFFAFVGKDPGRGHDR